MDILIVYATYSSGTETAALLVKDLLEKLGHTVSIKKAVNSTSTDLSTHDLVVLASPSWWVEKDGQPHIQMGELLAKSSDASLANKRFAIFGLGDSTYAHFCGAVGEMEKFVEKQGGTKVIDSLRIDSFYFDEEKNSQLLTEWVDKLQAHL